MTPANRKGTKKANRKYKDSIFRKYFSDKERLRSLYSALAGISEDEIRHIDIKTLENILYGDVANDLAFLVNHAIIVISEHMGSFSYNLPARLLRYYVSVIETLIEVKKLFGRKMVKIPAPEFYILYNGKENLPREIPMKLSDAFPGAPDGECSLELRVKLININHDAGHELLEKCPYIKQYSFFVAKVRESIDRGAELEEAMKSAIEYCKKHGVMLEFLQEHGMEVQKMELGITFEELEEIRREEAYEDGRKEGIEEIARNLKSDGIPMDVIARNTGLSEEDVNAL